MEVEANSRRPEAAGSDWPMNCICNLCSCGSHSCASFALKGTGNHNNRCRGPNRSSSLAAQPAALGDASESEDQASDNDDAAAAADCQLDSLGEERYLATSAAATGASSPAKRATPSGQQRLAARQQEEKPDELVHVLVTRPAIASKPRDNIIFEGDMDLRTTFETSYEALARMRLDQWKRHQEATKIGVAGAAPAVRKTPSPSQRRLAASRRQISPILPDDNQLEADGQRSGTVVEPPRRNQGVSRPAAGNSHDIDSNKMGPAIRSGGKQQQSKQPAEKQNGPTPTPRSRTPFAVADTNSQNIHAIDATDWDYHYNLNRSSRLALNSSPLQQQQQINDSPYKHERQRQHHHQPASGLSGTRDGAAPPAAAANDYVDPDLAPIIVYDANMNRLERVGMRKRSKYRPSTSLRSGARGLFGDQAPEPARQEPRDNSRGRVSRDEDKASAMPTDHTSGEQAPKSGDQVQEIQTMASAERQTVARGSVSQRARNLKNSSQTPDRLVYSERNLPVNTKRRVEGNVNMRDHVREQQIVDGGRYTAEENTTRNLENIRQAERSDSIGAGEERGDEVALERDLADIRLAEQEEAAANAEIRRVAARDPAAAAVKLRGSSSLQRHQPVIINSKAGASETPTSSRQSRMQRTCQEQSFHIGQNDYPAEPSRINSSTFEVAKFESSSAKNSTHASPQSRVYNNLFSESPDFILTTGGEPALPARTATEDAGDRLASSKDDVERRYKRYVQQVNADEQIYNGDRLIDSAYEHVSSESRALVATDSADFGDHYHHYNEDVVGSECRVTKLAERFQYVGSKSGHKYFVEKILDSE